MGGRSTVKMADALDSEAAVKGITSIGGAVYRTKSLESVYGCHLLPNYTEFLEDRMEYAKSSYVQYSSTDPFVGKRLVEPYEGRVYVI